MKLIISSLLLAVSLAAQAATHSAALAWVDNQNPSSTTYNVLRADGLCSGTPTYATLATAVKVKTYVDSTVVPGNYCYVVTATAGGVTSAPSNTSMASVPSFAPQQLTVTVQ